MMGALLRSFLVSKEYTTGTSSNRDILHRRSSNHERSTSYDPNYPKLEEVSEVIFSTRVWTILFVRKFWKWFNLRKRRLERNGSRGIPMF
jgi:hypothetical protein